LNVLSSLLVTEGDTEEASLEERLVGNMGFSLLRTGLSALALVPRT
jgi:hypothetical protein